MPSKKEIHFFSLHYANGIEWYKDHFRGKLRSQICGEITPYYSFHPFAMQRISKTCPSVKLILLVRDPIERSISQYFHSVRIGHEYLPIKEAFKAEKGRLVSFKEKILANGFDTCHQENSYISRSRYELQIEEILRYFPESQLLVCKSEELFANPDKAMNNIGNFLGYNINKLCDNQVVYGGLYSKSDNELKMIRDYANELFQETYVYMKERYGITWN